MAERYAMTLYVVTLPHPHMRPGWEIWATAWEQARTAAVEAFADGWTAVTTAVEAQPYMTMGRWFVCPGCRVLHKTPCCSMVLGDPDCGPCCPMCPTCPTEIRARRPRDRGLALPGGETL